MKFLKIVLKVYKKCYKNQHKFYCLSTSYKYDIYVYKVIQKLPVVLKALFLSSKEIYEIKLILHFLKFKLRHVLQTIFTHFIFAYLYF